MAPDSPLGLQPTLALDFQSHLLNQVVDIALAGFCSALFLNFALYSCLPARRTNESQWISDVITTVALLECAITHVLCAPGQTVTLAFDSGISDNPVLVRPLKLVQILCAVPCIASLRNQLGCELGLLTKREILIDIVIELSALVSLLAAVICSWSVAGFVIGLSLSTLAFARVSNTVKTVATGAYRAGDANTRAVMRCIPVLVACFMWPATILLWIDAAGGAGSLTSGTAEAASGALFTVGICLLFLLWSARNTEEVAAKVQIALYKVEQKSASADARNEAKRSFMRYIFHELRVPLNAIMLGLQDMAETAAEAMGRLPDSSEAYGGVSSLFTITDVTQSLVSSVTSTAAILIGNATAMGKLLDDFLSLEKIEEGKFELEPVEFRVRDMVDDATRMFAAPCAAKGLTLLVNSATPVPDTINGDVHKLRQVLCNYISNAIKFSPQESTITVSLMTMAEPVQQESDGAERGGPRPFIVVSVIDQGVGISTEDQAKLFQPFNQIKAGARQKGKGTGLGLSICKRIIELSGGVVGCESAEGKGSRFYFQVPVDGPPAQVQPAAGPSSATGSGSFDLRVGSSHASSPLSATTAAVLSSRSSSNSNGNSGSSSNTSANDGKAEFTVTGNESRRSSISSIRRLPSARIAPSPPISPPPPPRDRDRDRERDIGSMLTSRAGFPPRSPAPAPAPSPAPSSAPRPHVALTVNTEPTNPASGSGFFPLLGDNQTSRDSRAPLMEAGSSASSTPATSHRPAADSDATEASTRSASTSVISSGLVYADGISSTPSGSTSQLQALPRAQSRFPMSPTNAQLTHAVVVDDVKSNRDIFGRMLAWRGVTTIHYAEDGLEAIALLDNLLDADLNRIQAWFLDKEMPNCDGHECAQHLRTRGITTPIFGVTGNALAEDRREFIAAGVDAVITKPVSMDAVDSVLVLHGLRLLPAPSSSSTPSSRSSTPGPRR